MRTLSTDARAFFAARDYLLAHRADYDTAYAGFQWPRLDQFNWALDVFDVMAANNDRSALRIVRDDGSDSSVSYAELRDRSNQVANALRALGARRGDRLLLMLPNVLQTWETILASMKLGVVVVPATPQLTPTDLVDRFDRGAIRHVVTDGDGAPKFAGLPHDGARLVVGADAVGWTRFESASKSACFTASSPRARTRVARGSASPSCAASSRRMAARSARAPPRSAGWRFKLHYLK